jgi:hypothetical protein
MRITAERRDGRIAIFFEADEWRRWGIWDLPPKDVTEEVLEAIASAVTVGIKFKTSEIQRMLEDEDDVNLSPVKYI